MTGLWSSAEKERQALQAEFARRATAQMLTAGALTMESLTPQARRTLAWLAESDDPTVTGIADLLTAAHAAGRTSEQARRHDDPATAPSDRRSADDQPSGRPVEPARPDSHSRRPVDQVAERLAALSQRGDDRTVEL